MGPAGPCKQLGSNRRPHFRENLVYLYRLCGGGETHKKGSGFARHVLAKLCGNRCRPNVYTAMLFPRALIPTDRAHHILNILRGLLTKGKRKKRGGRGRWRRGFPIRSPTPPAQMLPCRVNGINANFGYKFPQYTIFHLCRLLHRYHQRRKKPLWLRMSPFHFAMTLDTKERAE